MEAEHKLKRFLINRKMAQAKDKVQIHRPDYDSPHIVMINGVKKGTIELDSRAEQFVNFKADWKPKYKGKSSYAKVKEARKELWKKKEYTIGDFIKNGKMSFGG